MHGKPMRYLVVAGAALLAGLLLAGTSVQSLLPFVLLLACPLMMVLMMRAMGGHGQDTAPPERTDRTVDRADR